MSNVKWEDLLDSAISEIEYEQLTDIVDICQNLSLSLDDSINELKELEVNLNDN